MLPQQDLAVCANVISVNVMNAKLHATLASYTDSLASKKKVYFFLTIYLFVLYM